MNLKWWLWVKIINNFCKTTKYTLQKERFLGRKQLFQKTKTNQNLNRISTTNGRIKVRYHLEITKGKKKWKQNTKHWINTGKPKNIKQWHKHTKKKSNNDYKNEQITKEITQKHFLRPQFSFPNKSHQLECVPGRQALVNTFNPSQKSLKPFGRQRQVNGGQPGIQEVHDKDNLSQIITKNKSKVLKGTWVRKKILKSCLDMRLSDREHSCNEGDPELNLSLALRGGDTKPMVHGYNNSTWESVGKMASKFKASLGDMVSSKWT